MDYNYRHNGVNLVKDVTFQSKYFVSMWPIWLHFKEDIINLGQCQTEKISLPPYLTEPGVNICYVNKSIHNQLALICIQELEIIIKHRAKSYC